MKKLLSLLTVCALGIAMIFSLTACSDKAPQQPKDDAPTPSADNSNPTDENQSATPSNPTDEPSDSTNDVAMYWSFIFLFPITVTTAMSK